MKIFANHLAFFLIPYLIFDFFSDLLDELGLKKNTFLRSPPRELIIQRINNNYYREQLQILQMLAENEA